MEKEGEIKQAFERIRREVGLAEGSDNKELLGVFSSLYEKNAIMKEFVREVKD